MHDLQYSWIFTVPRLRDLPKGGKLHPTFPSEPVNYSSLQSLQDLPKTRPYFITLLLCKFRNSENFARTPLVWGHFHQKPLLRQNLGKHRVENQPALFFVKLGALSLSKKFASVFCHFIRQFPSKYDLILPLKVFGLCSSLSTSSINSVGDFPKNSMNWRNICKKDEAAFLLFYLGYPSILLPSVLRIMFLNPS